MIPISQISDENTTLASLIFWKLLKKRVENSTPINSHTLSPSPINELRKIYLEKVASQIGKEKSEK